MEIYLKYYSIRYKNYITSENIYICRHGESLFNKYGIPEKDCGLTNDGIVQSSKLSGYVDYVICSPMKRTQETLKYSKIKYGGDK